MRGNQVRNAPAFIPLDRDPLDFIECDRITGAIVQLGGAWAFVRRHGLGIFQCVAGTTVSWRVRSGVSFGAALV